MLILSFILAQDTPPLNSFFLFLHFLYILVLTLFSIIFYYFRTLSLYIFRILPTGSEVPSPIAVKPPKGHAVIHRAVTVLHAGGEILSGTK